MGKKARIVVFLLILLLPMLAVQAVAARDVESLSLEKLVAFLACPAAPAGLPDNVEPAGEEFCLFYDDPDTTADQANRGADHTADYWEAYVDDMVFPAPEYSDVAVKFHARLLDTVGCNGSVNPGTTYINVNDGCDSPASIQPQMYQLVFGHETYHQVQLSDGGNDPASNNFDALWFHEGTARSIEDKVFENVDHWPNALSAPFSYNKEVNNYLSNPNRDITSNAMRYESALWWTYYSEQCGADIHETRRGVDAFGELWDAAMTADNIAALNNALSTLGCPNFDSMFRQFIVANWTKDLTGLPDDSYNYDDEDEAGNPASYGPIAPTDGGTIDSGTSASWTGQNVTKYGAMYFSATPHASDCEVITASFNRTGGSTEFYHVVTQNGSTFNTHVEGSGASWEQSFLNDGVTKIVAIAGGQSNSPTVDVELSCASPVIDIELPNELAPAYVGPFGSPDNIVVQVSVTNGSPTGPVVGGLSNSDFQVEVGGLAALVLGGGFVQEEYFLLVDTPAQAANGPYDLEVFLEEPGTSTVIASDLEADAIVYDNTDTDHVVVTDVSGSMGWDGKMQAAKDAAILFIDASNSSEGLGLASYNHDVVDTLAIQFGISGHRTDARNQVNGYFDSGATSIGDGLDEAVTLRGGSPTGNARCQFTLLSDGMENFAQFWTDVEAAVVATGCPVMTIAFGQASNELLMQDIATTTGGAAYYNDVFVSALRSAVASADETEIELGDTYLHALCEAQGCERILSEQGTVSKPREVATHNLSVDSSVDELTVVLDWAPIIFNLNAATAASDFELRLTSPEGTVHGPPYAFESDSAGHVGFEIADPETGSWKLEVIYLNEIPNRMYQISAYGQTDLALEMVIPGADSNSTGEYKPLYAIWVPGGHVEAIVTAPDGTETTVPMYDDGQHGDGEAGDGFFAGLYTLVTQAPAEQPVDETGVPNPPDAFEEGGYQVKMMATIDGVTREAKGAFSEAAGPSSDPSGIPDDFIEEHCPGAPQSDADLDQSDCSDEYFLGTDPNNSDTDGGGENDGSEDSHGHDPLNAGDDMIEAPDFVHTTAQNGSVLLTYDVKAEYEQMVAYRSTSTSGPWLLIKTELPLEGSYTDGTVTNDTGYYYCVLARNSGNHWSAVVCSESVTPRVDPIPPEAAVIINGGEPKTIDHNVVLSFEPKAEPHLGALSVGEGDGPFDDITEVQISNHSSMAGASWQTFEQGIPWTLLPGNGLRTVYVRFRDASGNESAGPETGSIQIPGVYLPFVNKQ